MAKSTTPSFFDLIEACSKPGCPVCRLVERSVIRSLNYLFYESVNDIPTRAVLRSSRGYCPVHAALLLSGAGNPLGVSIIYQDVLTNVLRDLPVPDHDPDQASRTGRLTRKAANRLKQAVAAVTPKTRCPACVQRDNVTELVLGILVEAIPGGELTNHLAASEGLCLPHFSLAVQHKQGGLAFETLLALQREKWQALNAELAEFIRKNDYRFKEEEIGSERDAWRRVLSLASGNPAAGGDE